MLTLFYSVFPVTQCAERALFVYANHWPRIEINIFLSVRIRYLFSSCFSVAKQETICRVDMNQLLKSWNIQCRCTSSSVITRNFVSFVLHKIEKKMCVFFFNSIIFIAFCSIWKHKKSHAKIYIAAPIFSWTWRDFFSSASETKTVRPFLDRFQWAKQQQPATEIDTKLYAR